MTVLDNKLLNVFAAKDVDMILVSDTANMQYLSNFTGDTGFLVFTKDHRYLLTDSRYTVMAKEDAPNFDIVEVSSSNGYFKCFQDIIDKYGIKRLGFENDAISFSVYNSIKEKIKVDNLVFLDDELDKLRRVKTPEELRRIKTAEEIGDRAFEKILNFIKPGVTELQIAAELEYYMKCEGATRLSFDTIAASGINSSKPHAIPTTKAVEDGDFVTMDFGCVYEGYCSDMTRTVAVGNISEKQKEVYDIVLKAQLTALDFIREGKICQEVDGVARSFIEEAGYGDYFGHSLGHSVGRYIHEGPRLGKGDTTLLLPNMIETIEPGIYIEGEFGVRIEDLVCVTQTGCDNYTQSLKELIILK